MPEEQRRLQITVIGLGRVGTVAAASLATAGHCVLGVDIDPDRIALLRAGRAPFYEPGLPAMLQSAVAGGGLRFEHRDAVAESLGDIALIAAGTPPTPGGGADLSQVRAALTWLKSLPPGDTVAVMKSTVPPGAGQRISDGELRGAGIRYVSNPEFLREGQAVHDWRHPDRIVIGAGPGDTQSVAVVKAMHAGIAAPCIITDVTSAEMIKYASNAYLATRISFINEIAALCGRVGASIDAVSDGLAMDARTGSRIYAGVGYGGSCFPKDVRALDHLALTSGVNVDLLRSVINVNNRQRLLPLYTLRERFSGAVGGLRVGILGLAFKPNTDDIRDAPSLDLIRALTGEGAIVSAYDPRAMPAARPHLPDSVTLAATAAAAASQARAVVLMTEWEQFINADWTDIARRMRPPRFVYDGRNALDAAELTRLGFQYAGVGRSAPAGRAIAPPGGKPSGLRWPGR